MLARRIQRVWKGYLGRKAARHYRAQLTKFALMVQRIFRGKQVMLLLLFLFLFLFLFSRCQLDWLDCDSKR